MLICIGTDSTEKAITVIDPMCVSEQSASLKRQLRHGSGNKGCITDPEHNHNEEDHPCKL